MSLVKQKQVENLIQDLAVKANDNAVLKTANNLSDVTSASDARSNLDVLSSTEVQNMVTGASQARSVADMDARDALSALKVTDRVFVSNDGDGKWALYIVTAVTDGAGSTSTFEKVADKDLFENVLTADAIKTAYESNANTNAFTDAEKTKLGYISASIPVDLDDMASELNDKVDTFVEEEESFTGMVVEGGQDNKLTLTYAIKPNHRVTVFFEGLKIENVSYIPDTKEVNINVPYQTEEGDVITVQYVR